MDGSPSMLRGLKLPRLVCSPAGALGVGQAALWYWACFVAGAQPEAASVVAVVLVLSGANAALVPRVLRGRERRDAWGRAARIYTDAAILTLLVDCAIAASAVLVVLVASLMGAVGTVGEPREIYRGLSLGLAGGAVALGVWGYSAGQARIETSRVPVRLPGLDPALAGLRIVQISDLHIGNSLDGEKLVRMVERVGRVEADVLVLTGDIFDRDPSFLESGALALSGLRARHGVYAVLGNHDADAGRSAVAAALGRHAPGIRILRDETVRLPVAAPLYLAGVDDRTIRWWSRDLEYPSLESLAHGLPDDGPTVLLAHNPELVGQASRLGFSLVLSGHTHGGQLALPGLAAHINAARALTRYTRGVYRVGGTTLYVNRGLGVVGPAVRIAADREIAVIELAAELRP